ncbi:hypothetical protein T09_11957 [Trichinella sp. T9]|nr:hypothetical protein T09_11957 [Trichinella sp. T9]
MVAVASDVVSFGGVCAHLFVARGVLNHNCNDRRDSTETESDAPARYVFEMKSWLSRPEDFLVLQNIPN